MLQFIKNLTLGAAAGFIVAAPLIFVILSLCTDSIAEVNMMLTMSAIILVLIVMLALINHKKKDGVGVIIMFYGIFMIIGVLKGSILVEHHYVPKSEFIHQMNVINDYRHYYGATEMLLDSLGLDIDDPILSSDVGSRYLDMKCKVDSCQN